MANTRISDLAAATSLADADVMPVVQVSGSGPVKAAMSLIKSYFWGTVGQFTAQQNFPAAALVDGATISWNLNTQQVASVTLAGNRTLSNPTNLVNGGTYALIVKQDATGNRTLSYGSTFKWMGGTTPALSATANAVDILVFISDGTNLYGVANLGFA